MEIYGGFLQAQIRKGFGTEIQTKATTLCADSEEEALGVCLKTCKAEFPESQGWFQHQVGVCTVTEAQITIRSEG